jgi:hypothetical protein
MDASSATIDSSSAFTPTGPATNIVTSENNPLLGKGESGGDTVTGAPRRWLRVEASVLLAGSLVAYSTTREPWWLVPLVVLLPDLAMLGYLGASRLGAHIYNVVHATPVPALLVGLGWWQNRPLVAALGLVWLAHVGMDRLLGYGLKYGDDFQHTHLGHLGRHKA